MSLIPETWACLERGQDFCVVSRTRSTGATVWRLSYKPGVRGGKTDWRVTGILFPKAEWKPYSGTPLSHSEIDTRLREYCEGVR